MDTYRVTLFLDKTRTVAGRVMAKNTVEAHSIFYNMVGEEATKNGTELPEPRDANVRLVEVKSKLKFGERKPRAPRAPGVAKPIPPKKK